MDQQTTSNNQRPLFLTIVCILSFVGLGWSIVQSFTGLIFTGAGEPLMDLVKSNMEIAKAEVYTSDPDASVFVNAIFDATTRLLEILPLFIGITSLLSLLALTGVILMWMLKRTGFYIYTGAKVIGLFIPVALLGYNFLSMFMTMGMVFTSAIFITLYAFNFKVLK